MNDPVKLKNYFMYQLFLVGFKMNYPVKLENLFLHL